MSKKIQEACMELITKPELVDLTTIDADGYPQTRAVANMRYIKLFAHLESFYSNLPPFRIYLGTHGRSDKVKQIRANQKSSVYFIQPEAFHSLLLVGDLIRIKDKEIKKALWVEGWEQFYPDGPEGSTFAVFQMDPFYAKGWYKDRPFSFKL